MKRRNVFTVSLAIVLLGLSVTGFNQGNHAIMKTDRDTIPARSEKKIRNLDDAMDQVDLGFDQLDKVDMKKMKLELESAMKQLNEAKIQMNIEKAMREVDLSKAKAELERVRNEMDNGQIKAQLESALAELNSDKMRKSLNLEKIQLEKLQEQLKDIHPQIERSMKEARKSLEKAKAEMQEYKSFLNDLERDGLIDTKSTYTIKAEGGSLIINGKQQGEEINRKYQHFLKDHKDFTIEKSEDNFSIHNNK